MKSIRNILLFASLAFGVTISVQAQTFKIGFNEGCETTDAKRVCTKCKTGYYMNPIKLCIKQK